jgi:hypothetical protein
MRITKGAKHLELGIRWYYDENNLVLRTLS